MTKDTKRRRQRLYGTAMIDGDVRWLVPVRAETLEVLLEGLEADQAESPAAAVDRLVSDHSNRIDGHITYLSQRGFSGGDILELVTRTAGGALLFQRDALETRALVFLAGEPIARVRLEQMRRGEVLRQDVTAGRGIVHHLRPKKGDAS